MGEGGCETGGTGEEGASGGVRAAGTEGGGRRWLDSRAGTLVLHVGDGAEQVDARLVRRVVLEVDGLVEVDVEAQDPAHVVAEGSRVAPVVAVPAHVCQRDGREWGVAREKWRWGVEGWGERGVGGGGWCALPKPENRSTSALLRSVSMRGP